MNKELIALNFDLEFDSTRDLVKYCNFIISKSAQELMAYSMNRFHMAEHIGELAKIAPLHHQERRLNQMAERSNNLL